MMVRRMQRTGLPVLAGSATKHQLLVHPSLEMAVMKRFVLGEPAVAEGGMDWGPYGDLVSVSNGTAGAGSITVRSFEGFP